MDEFILSFTVNKSKRKNAKCKFIDILHFEPGPEEYDIHKISDCLEKIIIATQDLQNNQHCNFIVSCFIYAKTNSQYKNTNDALYPESTSVTVTTETKEFFSVEQLLNFIYECYQLCNNGTLSLKTLHNNPSIRYHINRYYSGEWAGIR